MLAQAAPDNARIGGRSQPLERDAVRVQQARHVVVRRDEQRGGIGERRVACEQRGFDVPVRGDDRQIGDDAVQLGGDAARRRGRRQQEVRVDVQRLAHPSAALDDRGAVAAPDEGRMQVGDGVDERGLLRERGREDLGFEDGLPSYDASRASGARAPAGGRRRDRRAPRARGRRRSPGSPRSG